MAGKAKPWDQLPDEPDAAYKRFLVYRNLLADRSLEAAYREFQRQNGQATESRKKPWVSGQWQKDCKRYNWPERALKWDIANLQAAGRESAVLFVQYVRMLMKKSMQAARTSPGPETWEHHLATANGIHNLIPQEAIEAVMDEGAADEEEGSGGSQGEELREGPGGVLPGHAERQADPGAGTDSQGPASSPA